VLWRQLGDRISEADTLASLGLAELRQDRYAEAADYLRQALALCRKTGDIARQALAHNGLGEVHFAVGQLTDARGQHAAALSLASRAEEKYEQARAHDGLASVYAANGAEAQARRHWQEALTRYSELGAPQAEQVRKRLNAMRGNVPAAQFATGNLNSRPR
jgi:tetratricopeptide (TPR) repeat protein